tara:strand:- start:33217 stop:33501 length:285 start_codon:yes stop_codon:yes gene_type:complete
MNKEEIAQWVIHNRYPKSELEKMSDCEMYYALIDKIKQAINFTGSSLELKDKNTHNLRDWARLKGYALTKQEFIKDGLIFSVSDIYAKYISREE